MAVPPRPATPWEHSTAAWWATPVPRRPRRMPVPAPSPATPARRRAHPPAEPAPRRRPREARPPRPPPARAAPARRPVPPARRPHRPRGPPVLPPAHPPRVARPTRQLRLPAPPPRAAAAAAKPPIVIGNIGDYSGIIGTLMKGGNVMAAVVARYVNEHGGLDGHPLQVVTGDAGGDPARALSLVRDMVGEQGRHRPHGQPVGVLRQRPPPVPRRAQDPRHRRRRHHPGVGSRARCTSPAAPPTRPWPSAP